MSDVSDQIAADALKPQATTADGVSITRRALTDQIAADNHLRNIEATKPANAAAFFRGINCVAVPPGGYQ